MRKLSAALLVFSSSLASAGVLNVEFKFTPYTGDLKQDEVQAVAGHARLFLNNVLVAEQDIDKGSLPVLFDDREIGPSVWLPVDSIGPALRKGKNKLRIEFQPSNAKAPYSAQFSWASVLDQTSETSDGDSTTSTNQGDEGMDTKKATGPVVFERSFVADFAKDLPWHHYPVVTALSDADKQQLAAAVTARAAAFKPPFADVYRSIEGKGGLQVPQIKKAKCLDAAYAAGIRVALPSSGQLDFALTGNPEVLVQRKAGPLYDMGSQESFARIKGDEAQMCAAMTLSVAYPPHLAFVRKPDGSWDAVY